MLAWLSGMARAEDKPAAAPRDTWGLDGSNPDEPAATPPEPAAPAEPEPAPEPAKPAPPASTSRELTSGHHDDTIVRYTLEAFDIRGNTRTSSRVILRYVRFKPGDVLDVDDPEVELTRFRLLG